MRAVIVTLLAATAFACACRTEDSDATSQPLPASSATVSTGPAGSTTVSAGAGGSTGEGGAGGSVAASGGGGSLPHCEATDPRAVPVTLWAEPDAGEAPFVESLTKATSDIRVMVYMMGYGGILDTLKAKAGAGVDVRVLLDVKQIDINQKYFDQLTEAGAEVRWSDPAFSYMHAKSFVVDGAEATISTGNYLVSNIENERNFVARDADPDDVASLAALFDADWEQAEPDLACTRLVVSPVNARDRLLALIGSATQTLAIESMQFADTEIRDAVAERHAAGVEVRVLLADPSWIDANLDAAAFLAQSGIPARSLETPRVHVKAIVVDGVRAYMGSENLSYTSLSKNREVGLVITEPDGIATMQSTFETDWAAATPFGG